AERRGSRAVAKAIMVKSGTRKNTIDRLTVFLGVTCASRVKRPADRSCRDQQSVIRKTHKCQWTVTKEFGKSSPSKRRRIPGLGQVHQNRRVGRSSPSQRLSVRLVIRS